MGPYGFSGGGALFIDIKDQPWKKNYACFAGLGGWSSEAHWMECCNVMV